MFKDYLKRIQDKAVVRKTLDLAKKPLGKLRAPNRDVDRRALVPVIIFQPGKVGSLTVQASLEETFRQLKILTPIYHSHALNHLDEREKFVRETRKNPAESLVLIQEWKRLRKKIVSHPKQEWNVISLVRDPVAMKVSALFHLLYQHIPDWQERYERGDLPMSEIEELFYSKREFGFHGLEQWYDRQVKALWGIDIFASPFPTDKGYQIYKSGRINLLVIRLEDLNYVAQDAFEEFMGLEKFTLVSTNVGEEKSYVDLYKQFKTLPLPPSYVGEAYQTRYARHFYTEQELDQFRQRWIKPSK